ncbi:hypothetical protein WBP07_23625 [Novosphingobium sp. BL-8A]|uniref:hypothetical protein n=1 Tax=Novosphingobium sp. BL-8A TaxID=3127639 RepID=UPI003756C326
MNGLHLLSYVFGGAFLANCLPHLAAGMMGRAFQSPFAKPPGEGLSSARTNVIWGFANLVAAYFLVCRVGAFDLRNGLHALALGVGIVLLALFAAGHFGRFHGGNEPERP